MRLDKFLWYVRLFKTRSLASEQCKKSRIKVNNQIAKPSKEVHEGDIVEIKCTYYVKTIKITALPHQRIGPKIVNQFIEDLTPDEEYQKSDMIRYDLSLIHI